MNTPDTARSARPASHGTAYFLTEDSQSLTNSPARISSNTGRYTLEASAMSYRKVNSRARYASALYAAALAVLLTACSKPDASVEAAPKAATIHLSENANTADSADMPEVVVTASREKPKAIG
jgi:hypothetical protein